MDTAVQEQVRTQAIPTDRVRVLSLEADPTMTRKARTQRTIWRKGNLAAWQSYLESLSHYDPGHAYDIAHEYCDDWTTDPDYGADGVHLLDSTRTACSIPQTNEHTPLSSTCAIPLGTWWATALRFRASTASSMRLP